MLGKNWYYHPFIEACLLSGLRNIRLPAKLLCAFLVPLWPGPSHH